MKITYIIGAGASANALPLAKDINGEVRFLENPEGGSPIRARDVLKEGLATRMGVLAEQLKTETVINKLTSDSKKYNDHFIEDLNWLARESRKYSTIDTYAKYLFLSNGSTGELLLRLKRTLSTFFLVEQNINEKLDLRYLVFLTSIMNRMMFPENIKILNWNYDAQFQIASSYFQFEGFSRRGRITKKAPGLIQYYPEVGSTESPAQEYNLVHLNGIAGYRRKYDGYGVQPYTMNFNESDINKIYHKVQEDFGSDAHLVTFAWEKTWYAKKAIQIAKEMIFDTEILVIIGYSFPFFNREIDNDIIDAINTAPLKNIYFQDPFLDGSFLENQFGLYIEKDSNTEIFSGIKLHHIKKTDQFYIPYQF